MIWAENLVGYIIEKVLSNCLDELEILGRDINRLKAIIPPNALLMSHLKAF